MTQESEKKPARRVDDKLPGTSVDWSDAPRFNALGIAETWSVTVEAEGQRILCISDEHVAGLDAGPGQFKDTIRSCSGRDRRTDAQRAKRGRASRRVTDDRHAGNS